MNKDFSRGIQFGHEDGKTGNNRLPIRSAQRLFHISSYLFGAQNRDAEFIRGYTQGFSDETRFKYIAPAFANSSALSQSTLGKNIMANNSIEHQIELLKGLKSYLENFQEKLLGVSENYQRKVDALESEDNLISNIHLDYSEQQLEPTRNSLSNVVNQISDNDIPAIERYIAWLEALPRP